MPDCERGPYSAIASGGLAAIALLFLCAASNRPTPAPREAEQKPQYQAAAEQQKPQADQRGTKASPLVIEIPPTADSERKAAEETAEQKAAASREGWLVGFTGVLTAATILLFVATFGLWLSTRRLWRGAEAQAVDFKKSINIAKESADTALIQANIAQASTRPYVFPEFKAKAEGTGSRIKWRLGVSAKNSGNTPAVLTHVLLMTSPEEPRDIDPNHTAWRDPIQKVIDAGKSVHTKDAPIDPFESRSGDMFVFGYFDYLDMLKNRHSTWFCIRANCAAMSDPVKPSFHYVVAGPGEWNRWD